MNYAHIHLILTHVPVIGIGAVILLLIKARARRSNQLMTVALVFTILLSLVTIPVYIIGEPAEEVVENLPGIPKELIGQHEEQAEIAYILVEVTGAIALITLIVQRCSGKLGQKDYTNPCSSYSNWRVTCLNRKPWW
jgi:ABC-type multidrug transport system permease subunit